VTVEKISVGNFIRRKYGGVEVGLYGNGSKKLKFSYDLVYKTL
jgi:hypothetical protein